MIAYGGLTPGSNGLSMAILGAMLAILSAPWVVLGLVPEAATGEGEGKTVLAGDG